MRKKSVASTLASISKQAKQHLQLTPKSKPKRGRGRRRHRRSLDASESSSTSSFEDASSVSSDISGSDISSCYSEESKRERHSRNRSDKGRRYQRSREDKRYYIERSKRRDRGRSDRRRYSPDSHGEYTPKHHATHSLGNDAAQMIDLLMRILPFYGNGDGNSDAIVIDTIHRLPPHALEMQDTDGNSLLLLACQNGAFDLLPQLLSKGCNVNTRNNAGASCLHFACFVDTFSPDAAMMLVRHGAVAEVAEHEFGCTPLHWAAFSGNVQLCATLCRAGANTKTLDKNGCDPIHYSKQNGHSSCTQLLLSFSAGKSTGPVVTNSSSEKTDWVRCLDGSTGSSFYHNKDTGESLWGEDFRKVDKAVEPSALGITSPEKVKSENNKSDIMKSESVQLPPANSSLASSTGRLNDTPPTSDIDVSDAQSPSNVTKVSEQTALTAIKEDPNEMSSREEVETNLETCQNGPLQGIPEKTSPLGAVKEIEEEAVTSHVKVVLQHACEPPHKNETQVADILDDLVETSSIEDVEQTEITKPEDGSIVMPGDGHVRQDKQVMLPDSISRDPDLHFKGEKNNKLLAECAESTSGGVAKIDSSVCLVKKSPTRGLPADNLARNKSFEKRISTLHQRMETQFMSRMQHLEDKITQQNLETSKKVHDDSSKLKENVAEMACTILELRTESGAKDLEILSLKQSIVKAETDKISQQKQSMNACYGDGNVNDDCMKEKLVAAKTRHEQELAELKERLDQTTQALNTANERYGQAQRHVEIAEQMACEEIASSASVKSLFEKSQNGDLENDFVDDNKELEMKASLLETELTKTQAMHKASLAELHDRNKAELEQLKEQLHHTNSELTEAKIEKMELLLAKDEANNAMETALQNARSANTKIQEMTEIVKETETLKKLNEELHLSLQEETEKRKVLHNTLEDMKGRIRVYVRIRPLSTTEVKANYVNIMTKEDDRTCVMAGDTATASDVRDWEFDKIFNGSNVDGNSQEKVFQDTSLLLTSAVDGYNVCIFAYGQTGSGKTYTMLGSGDGCDQGLAPRVAHELFRRLKERESSYDIEVSVSMLELYTDKLCDLLVSNENEKECLGGLKIRLAEHTSSGLVEVDGAKTERVANAEELLEVISRGTRGRASSSTKMNDESSRSHMIATIVLSLRNRRTGKIVHGKVTLVDLAGSERVSKSGATGQQLKEAQSINKSLSALGDVIGALTSGARQHIPYRNHPLTMLMSDSIGGNAKTLMFVCCSPADYNRKETANSLDFAKRCRNVTNNAVTSKGAAGSTAGSNVSQIRALRKELSKIKEREKGVSAVKRRPMRRPGM